MGLSWWRDVQSVRWARSPQVFGVLVLHLPPLPPKPTGGHLCPCCRQGSARGRRAAEPQGATLGKQLSREQKSSMEKAAHSSASLCDFGNKSRG